MNKITILEKCRGKKHSLSKFQDGTQDEKRCELTCFDNLNKNHAQMTEAIKRNKIKKRIKQDKK